MCWRSFGMSWKVVRSNFPPSRWEGRERSKRGGQAAVAMLNAVTLHATWSASICMIVFKQGIWS